MNVGDYVRTRDGLIAKIMVIDNTSEYSEIILKTDTNDTIWCSYEEDLKSSPNIIDLIEVGDYVNGCPVLHKEENEVVCGLLLRYKEKDIKSVVTKEQFSQMEYKVGE